jgi:hypothetical protein
MASVNVGRSYFLSTLSLWCPTSTFSQAAFQEHRGYIFNACKGRR